jgi:hypothetical protein
VSPMRLPPLGAVSMGAATLVLLLSVVVLAGAPAWAAPPAPSPTSTPGPLSTLGPPPTPTTTAPAPTGPPSTSPSGDRGLQDRLRDRLPFPFGTGPGFPDIAGRIRDAINGWFRDLVASSLGPLLDMVARTILATPDLAAATSRVRELWWLSAGIANTCFVLLVTVGGVLVMTHETLQTSYGVKEIAPRLVVAFLAANLSLVICGQAIPLANALARALLGTGADPAHVQATLRTLALAPLDTSSGLLILVALVIAVMALALVASYVVRISLLIVLVAGAPLALACHALPKAEGLAYLWWRAFAGCLGIQLGQALVLAMAVRVFFQADRARVLGLQGSAHLVDLIVVGCLLWMLLRIPVWVSRLVFGRQGSTLVRLAKSYVIYRGIRSWGRG